MNKTLKTWLVAALSAVALSGLQAEEFPFCHADEFFDNEACCYPYSYTIPVHATKESGSENFLSCENFFSFENFFSRENFFNGEDFFISAEWLYWKTNGESLEFGVTKFTNLNTSSIPTSSFTSARVDNLDFKWDSGFRLGAGYNLPRDGWDVTLNWTYFRPKAHNRALSTPGVTSDSLTLSSGQRFIPIFSSVDFPGPISEASASWKTNLNLVDLELGRAFFASPCLALRPHVGFRFASINQRYNLTYVSDGVITTLARFFDKINMKNDFAGLGLRMGLHSTWELGCGLGFYFNGAASLVYGDHDQHQVEFFNDLTAGGPGDQFIRQRNHTRSLNANAEYNIGLQWSKELNCGRQGLLLRAGYEHQIFFGQNQFRSFTGITQNITDFATIRHDLIRGNGGDLSFHGFTFLAQIDF